MAVYANCINFLSYRRFLWDAHNCDDSPKDGELQLGVSFDYILNWNDLEQLWFLGMQILNSLMESVKDQSVNSAAENTC